MGKNAQYILVVSLFLLAAFAIGGYAYFRSREFLRGPQITITAPGDGSIFSEAPVTVSGHAQNVSAISLNDAPIFIDSQGQFKEKLLLLEGYNILTLKAQDRFGKKTEKTLELVYTPTATSSPTHDDDSSTL